MQKINNLFVSGYLDNSIRIFDLEQKPGAHYVGVIRHH